MYLQEGGEEVNEIGEVIATPSTDSLFLPSQQIWCSLLFAQLEEPLGQQVERISTEALPGTSKKVKKLFKGKSWQETLMEMGYEHIRQLFFSCSRPPLRAAWHRLRRQRWDVFARSQHLRLDCLLIIILPIIFSEIAGVVSFTKADTNSNIMLKVRIVKTRYSYHYHTASYYQMQYLTLFFNYLFQVYSDKTRFKN